MSCICIMYFCILLLEGRDLILEVNYTLVYSQCLTLQIHVMVFTGSTALQRT